MITNGVQTGTLLDATGMNGIVVRIKPFGDPTYQRIVGGELEASSGVCIYRDKYDTSQGSMVSGLVLCDAGGYPIESEHYMLREFTWSGNVSYYSPY